MGGGSSKPVPGVELVRRLDEVGLCADAEFWQGRRVKGGEDLLVRRTEKQKMGPDESALIDREVSTLRRLHVDGAVELREYKDTPTHVHLMCVEP